MKRQNTMTDDELAKAYMSGDNAAFDVLLSRYKTKVFSYIFSMVNDREVAEDIFQDVFIKIIVSLREGRYTNIGYFGYWVSRITRNVLIDHHRKEKILKAGGNDNNDLTSLKIDNLIESSCESNIIHNQHQKDVVNLMNHLPDTQREVVYMKFFENKSFKDIAQQTNVSINTSLGRMRYAIINMRRMAREHDIF